MASSASTPLPWASPARSFAARRSFSRRAAADSLSGAAAENITLTIVNSTDVHLAVALLRRVIGNGSLNFRLGCVFRDCRHEEISSAVAGLDLLAEGADAPRSIPGPRG